MYTVGNLLLSDLFHVFSYYSPSMPTRPSHLRHDELDLQGFGDSLYVADLGRSAGMRLHEPTACNLGNRRRMLLKLRLVLGYKRFAAAQDAKRGNHIRPLIIPIFNHATTTYSM